MNIMEIMEDFSGSNDHAILKGKRSKRLRPSSSASSTSCGGEFSRNSLVSSSPASSSTCTQEDEDMANCLILLARGGAGVSAAAGGKFSSRKFADHGKVGGGAYECKTCGRSFASFQALGGHRASHKKPKLLPPPPVAVTEEIDQKKLPPSAPPPRDDKKHQIKEKLAIATPPIPTRLLENLKAKTHECSLCGSEFASGQALGGHMRRHRPSVTTPAKIDPPSPDVTDEKTGNVLALDLNLPAPPEEDRPDDDDDDESDDQFSSNQQPRLIFSAAALVDCHY